MPRQPNPKPDQHVLLSCLDATQRDAVSAAAERAGYVCREAASAEDALQIVGKGAINVIVALAGGDCAELVQQAKNLDPLVEVLLVAEADRPFVPKTFELKLTPAALADARTCLSVLRQAMTVQNLRERNAALFRGLMQANAKAKETQVELEIRRSENRLLNAALASYTEGTETPPPASPHADEAARIERVGNNLQKLVEKLGEEFNRALDAMLFYSAQVLHQSGGSQEGAELSRWIEREVERQRESYQAVIQQYYVKSQFDDD